MGYMTSFEGSFQISPSLSEDHFKYLKRFSETRRMKRNPEKTINNPDPLRVAAGLPIGVHAEFYVGSLDRFGQDYEAEDLIEFNFPPKTQPALWCGWIPNEKKSTLEWNGQEKFYEYEKWLKYMLKNFFIPWNYILNGEICWFGEDRDDFGKLVIQDNTLKVKMGERVYI